MNTKPSGQEMFIRNFLTSICLYNQSLQVKNNQYIKWIDGELADNDCQNHSSFEELDTLICKFQSNMEGFEFIGVG